MNLQFTHRFGMQRLLVMLIFIFFLAAPITLTGCSKENTDDVIDEVEDVGEEIGDAIEDAGDEIEDATDNY